MITKLRLVPAYAGLVTAVSAVLRRMPGPARAGVVQACSTNVRNLSAGRWQVLATSLLVLDEDAHEMALPVLLVVLGLAEVRWGPTRAGFVLVTGHAAASLAVYAGLRAGLRLGRVDAVVADASDVGVSYGSLALTGTLVARSWYGLAGLAALVGPPLLHAPSFTDVGHALAAAAGVGLGLTPAIGLTPRISPARPLTQAGLPLAESR